MSGGLKTVARATVIITLGSILSRILGFLREVVVARYFGATAAMDAYLVAFVIPGMILSLLGGALPGTLIPVFVAEASEGRENEAWRMTNTLTNLVILALSLGAVVGWWLAPDLVPLVAPHLQPAVMAQAVYLTRIMLPMVVFTTLAGVATALLQAYQHFTVPALVGLPYNLLIIGFLLLFGVHWGIVGLAVASVLGAAVQWLFQVPAASFLGWRRRRGQPVLPPGDHAEWEKRPVKEAHFSFVLDLGAPGVKQVWLMLLPILVGGAVGQLNLIIDRIMASGLPVGSIAALNYANRVVMLPLSLYVSSLATAIFPRLSVSAAEGRWEDFRHETALGLRMTTLLTLPAAVGLMVLGEQIVRLLFERGAFTPQATVLTNQALFYYALGLLFFALTQIFIRAYWALKDTWTPTLVGFIAIGANILFNVIFVRFLAHAGLALGTSLASLVWVLLLGEILRRRIGGLAGKEFMRGSVKMLFASLIMAALVWKSARTLSALPLPGPAVAQETVTVGGAILVGAFSYGFLLWALGVPEAREVFALVRARVFRR